MTTASLEEVGMTRRNGDRLMRMMLMMGLVVPVGMAAQAPAPPVPADSARVTALKAEV